MQNFYHWNQIEEFLSNFLTKPLVQYSGSIILPILKKILSNNSKDKTSNNLWVKELMNCIQELSKLTF